MKILRIHVIYPYIKDNYPAFEAYLDNNDHFNREEGRAQIFTCDLEADAKVSQLREEVSFGNVFYVQRFFKSVGWINHFPNLEEHLDASIEV